MCVINEYTDLNLKYACVNTFEKKYTVDQTEISVLLDIVLGKSVSVK